MNIGPDTSPSQDLLCFLKLQATFTEIEKNALTSPLLYVRLCQYNSLPQDQYVFCHEVLADYMDKFENYANFKDMI